MHTDTKMCVHCGLHFDYKQGSGRLRGFCRKCNGMTCGGKQCMECAPIELRMELYEKGLLKELMDSLDTVMPISGVSKGGVFLP